MQSGSELKIDGDGFVSGKAPTAEDLNWVYQNLDTPLGRMDELEEVAARHGVSPGAVSLLKRCRSTDRDGVALTKWLMDKITPKGIGGGDDAGATKAALNLTGLERDVREDWNKCLAVLG